jgi:uncharacterized protein
VRYESQLPSAGLNSIEIWSIQIGMWHASILLRKGHRIRVALAGADVDTFRRYPPGGDVTWTVYRQSALASYVELPLRPL